MHTLQNISTISRVGGKCHKMFVSVDTSNEHQKICMDKEKASIEKKKLYEHCCCRRGRGWPLPCWFGPFTHQIIVLMVVDNKKGPFLLFLAWDLEALRASISRWRAFGPAWLRPLHSLGAQALWPKQKIWKDLQNMIVLTPACRFRGGEGVWYPGLHGEKEEEGLSL